MPLITSIHESLPYVDEEPTPAQRAAAEALIASERARAPDDPHHALLPPPYTPTFTEAMQAELARVASSISASETEDGSGKPNSRKTLKAIDFSRYEAPEETPSSSSASTSSKSSLQTSLQNAYTLQTYLRARRANLALLDSHGRNAWLVGNWQLEAELRALEAELAERKREIDEVTARRQRAQLEAGGELRSLEAGWRAGVSRVLETEAAAEELRRQILEARREA